MRLSLQGYFDLGSSLGLGDDVFLPPGQERVPDIAGIGMSNPLGEGLTIDLCARDYNQIMKAWKQTAIGKVADPEMELGYAGELGISCAEFKERLVALIDKHPVAKGELTIYAIGLVFVRLDHASGIPLEFLQGFHKCYEFAGYSVEVSNGVLQAARERATAVVGTRSERLRELSRRLDAKNITDGQGYTESKLFTSFSCLGLCADPNDDVAAIKQRLGQIEGQDFKALSFDYHGKMHFGWAASVLEPRTPGQNPQDALKEMARMLECVKIAHVFLGTCEVFHKLFLQETLQQVEGHIKGSGVVRSSRELNRLRTLALAVVGLTQYRGVADTDEDQRYFACWEGHANLADLHRRIQEQVDLLYNVQLAETQTEEARRERLLNNTILILTAFTFISVLVDSYEFVDHKTGWLQWWVNRAWALAALLTLLGVVLLSLLKRLSARR